MVLTNDDFEDARAALLRLQARAKADNRESLAHLISTWLYELETQRWVTVRSFNTQKLGKE